MPPNSNIETLRRLQQADEGIEQNRKAIGELSTDTAVLSTKIDVGFLSIGEGLSRIRDGQAKQTAANAKSFWVFLMTLLGLAGAVWGLSPPGPSQAAEAAVAPVAVEVAPRPAAEAAR